MRTLAKPRQCRARSCAGFTLLEVLVTLTLLGLIGVVAANGLHFGTAVWKRSAELGETEIERRLVEKLLRRMISQAYPLELAGAGRRPELLFEGYDNRLTLVASLPAQVAPRGHHLVFLGLSPDDDGMDLTLGWTGLSGSASVLSGDMPRPEQLETLLPDTARLSFRYYGPSPEGGPSAWQETWTSRARMPDLVKIAFDREGDIASARIEPLLIRIVAEARP